jgi:hypothetical protein
MAKYKNEGLEEFAHHHNPRMIFSSISFSQDVAVIFQMNFFWSKTMDQTKDIQG